MTREQARDFIITQPEIYLKQTKGGYICPICNSIGNKGHINPITVTKDGTHYTCWRGCFTNSDIIDIIGLERGYTDYNDKLRAAADIYGINIDNNSSNYVQPKRVTEKLKAAAAAKVEADEPVKDYSAFYLEAHNNLSKTDYYQQRGISKATAEYFNLGYVEEWKCPQSPTAPYSPRLIIPISKYYYLARDTRTELTDIQKKYSKYKVGKVSLFNIEALRTAEKPIFIVEGEIDAISIHEAGGIAVGLGGVNFINKFVEAASEIEQRQPYIISLDNDIAGKNKSTMLCNMLKDKNIKYYELMVHGKYKDANEALVNDRALLTSKIKEAEELATVAPAELVAQAQYTIKNQASYYIEQMRRELEEEQQQPDISTGFKCIDSIIGGGLQTGLYFIGAVSSLGKTTFTLQIADAIAKQGKDVLIVSLEMAKRELIAKSISRITKEIALKNCSDSLARCTADILNLKRQAGYSAEQKTVIEMAYNNYTEYAKHIYIYEGIGDITPESIRDKVQEHTSIYGEPPVVIIDYLQILQGDNDRMSDKQKTDKGVVELKRISRDYKTPVIAISSVNRSSYNEPITMESFKESGGIEFSSDILIGLQYKGMDYFTGTEGKKENEKERALRIKELIRENSEAAKAGKSQLIEAKILKNRNGSRGTAELFFYPMYNYFEEPTEKYNNEPAKPRRIR